MRERTTSTSQPPTTRCGNCGTTQGPFARLVYGPKNTRVAITCAERLVVTETPVTGKDGKVRIRTTSVDEGTRACLRRRDKAQGVAA